MTIIHSIFTRYELPILFTFKRDMILRNCYYLVLFLFSTQNFLLCDDKPNKPKYDVPIYPNELISVTTKRGPISTLIKRIGDNHKGIPAITITALALDVFIPPVEARRTSLGILFKALDQYKDNVSNKKLIINVKKFSIEISAIKLPVEEKIKLIDQSKYKITSYRVVLLRDKISLKIAIPIILRTYNKQWNQEAVLRYTKNDDDVYIFGLPDDVKILLKAFDTLNKIEMKKKDATAQAQQIIEQILNKLFLEKVDSKIEYYKRYIKGYTKEINEIQKYVKADDSSGARNIKNEIKQFHKLIENNKKLIKNLNIMKNLITKKIEKK